MFYYCMYTYANYCCLPELRLQLFMQISVPRRMIFLKWLPESPVPSSKLPFFMPPVSQKQSWATYYGLQHKTSPFSFSFYFLCIVIPYEMDLNWRLETSLNKNISAYVSAYVIVIVLCLYFDEHFTDISMELYFWHVFQPFITTRIIAGPQPSSPIYPRSC